MLLNQVSLNQLFTLWSTSNQDGNLKEEVIRQHFQSRHQQSAYGLIVLVGVGAFFAALFLIGLVALLFDVSSVEEAFLWGGLFAVMGFGLYKFINPKSPHVHDLIKQLSFYFVITGKCLLVGSVSSVVDIPFSSTFMALFLLLAFYRLYPMFLDRLLTGMLVAAALQFNMIEELKTIPVNIIHHTFLLLYLCVFCYSFMFQKIRELGFAALFVILINFSIEHIEMFQNNYTDSRLLALFFAGILLGYMPISKLIRPPWLLLVAGIAVASLAQAPQLLFLTLAIFVGMVSYEKVVISVATFFFPLFLVLYYYDLQLTLLSKSVTLAIGGAVFLSAWGLLKWVAKDKELS